MTEDPAAMVASMARSWADGDADGYADLFTADGTLIQPGVHVIGRPEIRALMAARFAGPLRGTRLRGRPESVRRLGPEAAVMVIAGEVLLPGESEPAPERRVRASWTLVRGHGSWRVAVYHNCARD
ncbi:hypothetical protein Acy02nite_40640 [Actinoplanes cyaneus]|uniref:DUF4440 domain-containing protein n=1 Tax=Actinoplanes cyaneus TaxID=52696 RepID=A0A919IIP4_9ACTN|nr:SgcJ/EcaC family oxidoreductase [Actinoplanes cyaneus]MCW2138225.1 hypothetical protein [Actinoplanes cyaneus]GID66183.1 hypothetical protein Acy02nite_40640 [Actinoplanes cyaneus]